MGNNVLKRVAKGLGENLTDEELQVWVTMFSREWPRNWGRTSLMKSCRYGKQCSQEGGQGTGGEPH